MAGWHSVRRQPWTRQQLMKAVVVPLVVVLAVLAWPCAAQDHYCSAADTVVSAGEQKIVANFTRRYESLWSTPIYLHPESAFEGVLLSTTTSSGTNVLWFPAHTGCFTHNRGWWKVLVACLYTDFDQYCYMMVGVCDWHCRERQPPGEPLSGHVVAVGASRWRAAEPPDNCTVIYLEIAPSYRYESCSPASKHPTTDSPSTTTTTTTDSPSTTTTTTTTTDSPSTPTTTTTGSPSTTTTTDCTPTTTTTNLLPMLPVVVVVVVAVVVLMVALVMMVMKIRHSRPGAPGLSSRSSSCSSLGFLYKQNFDNVAEYC